MKCIWIARVTLTSQINVPWTMSVNDPSTSVINAEHSTYWKNNSKTNRCRNVAKQITGNAIARILLNPFATIAVENSFLIGRQRTLRRRRKFQWPYCVETFQRHLHCISVLPLKLHPTCTALQSCRFLSSDNIFALELTEARNESRGDELLYISGERCFVRGITDVQS